MLDLLEMVLGVGDRQPCLKLEENQLLLCTNKYARLTYDSKNLKFKIHLISLFEFCNMNHFVDTCTA